MASVRGVKRDDRYVKTILEGLEVYRETHPETIVEAYRLNPACIRVRVIDPGFRGMDPVDRAHRLWAYLVKLPEEAQSQISMVVLVTPKEVKTTGASLEFDDGIPSRL